MIRQKKKLKKQKKLLPILLSLVVLSCASGQSLSTKNFEVLYRDCVTDYNEVVDQDKKCAKELDRCLDAGDINQDLIDDINRTNRRDKAVWFGVGFGVGSLVITGIALGAILGSR